MKKIWERILAISVIFVGILLLGSAINSANAMTMPSKIKIEGKIVPAGAYVGSGWMQVQSNKTTGTYNFTVYAINTVIVYAFAPGYAAYFGNFTISSSQTVLWDNITLTQQTPIAINITQCIGSMKNNTGNFVKVNTTTVPVSQFVSNNITWNNTKVQVKIIKEKVNEYLINTNKSIKMPIVIPFYGLIKGHYYRIIVLTNISKYYYNITANGSEYNFTWSNWTVDPLFSIQNVTISGGILGTVSFGSYSIPVLYIAVILAVAVIFAVIYIIDEEKHKKHKKKAKKHHKRR